jgi:hypothetical protein
MSTPTPTAAAAPAAPSSTAPSAQGAPAAPAAPPQPTTPPGTVTAVPAAHVQQPAQPAAPQQQGDPQQPQQQGEPQDVASLPQWAQDEIREARAEAAKYRQRAKETAQQAEPAAVPEGDVSRLPQWAQRAINTGQDATRQAATMRAMITAAPAAGADVVALLDSQSAMAALAQVDPGDAEAVKAAITAAVQANPHLAAQTAPHRAGAEFTGPPAGQQPTNLTDAIAARLGG